MKKTIRAGDIVRDLRARMKDHELMEKYQLSVRGLQSLFRQLLDNRVVHRNELLSRWTADEQDIDLADARRVSRHAVDFNLPVHEKGQPENIGEVKDITEKGVRIAGLSALVGQEKSFVIPADELFMIDPIDIQAVCRWTKQEAADEFCVAGYEITEIIRGSIKQLISIIESLTDQREKIEGAEKFADEQDSTETVDISGLFKSDFTLSGSFSLQGLRRTGFGKLLQALPVPALLVDEWHNVAFLNSSCERISVEYAKQQEQPFTELFPNAWVAEEALATLKRVYETRRSESYQAVLQIGTGRIWGRVHFRSIRMAMERSILLLIEDLTLEKEQLLLRQKHEEELIRERNELDERVRERTAELNRIIDQLEKEISERERAQGDLEASRASFTSIVEKSRDGIVVTDGSGTVLYSNSAANAMFADSAEGLRDDRFIVSADSEPVQEFEVTLPGGFKGTAEMRVFETEWKAEPAYLAVLRDVTERKKAEHALKASEEKMRLLIEASPVGIQIIQDGKIQYVNPAFVTMFGYEKPEEIVGLPVHDFYDAQDRHLVREMEDVAERESRVPLFHEMTGYRKGRRLFDISVWQTCTVFGGQPALLGFVVDLSESKELKAQLIQAQKMEAVGTLAGGVAHDFNNLLTAVLGFADLLLRRKPEGDPDAPDLRRIVQAACNGADLVRRLLTFSRKVETRPQVVDLNQIVAETQNILYHTVPKMIEIELRLADNLPMISVDPVQIEQILINLAVNAKDAMPEGGKLTIGTEHMTLDHEYCRTHLDAQPGRWVLLTVSDTGHGMDEETIQHIFEPFYTTKDVGQGTGLGLAIVYGIVTQSGGHIVCNSRPERGTVFKILFPALEGPNLSFLSPGSERPLLGTETVLLVDDEEFVRELGRRYLTMAGYQVLLARNGFEALDLYRQYKDEIVLVILDLVMPGMGGKQCLEELLKLNPSAKVLVATGQPSEDPAHESIALGAKATLGKPYVMDQFLRAVRDLLDKPR